MSAPVELSVSNICWSDGPLAQEEAVQALHNLGVGYVDLAPTKAWPEFATTGDVSPEEIDAYKRTLNGLEVAGFQSLTFGVDGKLFGDREGVEALSDRMHRVINLAHLVGARTIIFGSPKTRGIPEGMSPDEVYDRAATFFEPLANLATDRGVVLGIEPVSPDYVQNGFGQSAQDIIQFIANLQAECAAGYPALVPDTWAMFHNGDMPYAAPREAAELNALAPHWQVSEKGMGYIGDGPTQGEHTKFNIALGYIADLVGAGVDGNGRPHNGPIILALEMNKLPDDQITSGLRRAVDYVREQYPVVNS